MTESLWPNWRDEYVVGRKIVKTQKRAYVKQADACKKCERIMQLRRTRGVGTLEEESRISTDESIPWHDRVLAILDAR